MRCSSCGADLPDRALRCPECETPVTDDGAGNDGRTEPPQTEPSGSSDPTPSQPPEPDESFDSFGESQSTDPEPTDSAPESEPTETPQESEPPEPQQESEPAQEPGPSESERAFDPSEPEDGSGPTDSTRQSRRGRSDSQQPTESRSESPGGRSRERRSNRAERGPAGADAETSGQATQRSPGQPGSREQDRSSHRTERGGQQADVQPAQRPPGQPSQQQDKSAESATRQPGQAGQDQIQQQGRSLGARLGSAPVVGGLLYGTIAFVVNFFVTAMLVVAAAGEGDLDGFIGGAGNQGPGLLEVFGWFFYSAHTVEITAVTGSQSNSENFIELFYGLLTNPSVPKIAVYLAPAAILFLFALVLVSRASFDDGATRLDGAIAGGAIMLGYTVLTLVGATILFTYTAPMGGATVQPVLGSSVVFMCLLYPVASGGLAGFLTAG